MFTLHFMLHFTLRFSACEAFPLSAVGSTIQILAVVYYRLFAVYYAAWNLSSWKLSARLYQTFGINCLLMFSLRTVCLCFVETEDTSVHCCFGDK